MPHDHAEGVKCFSISGRMHLQRQRCLGMTDEERRWRAQWLKDQVLTPEEPRDVPEYYKNTTNFFRRLWKTPMHKLRCALEPSLGKNAAYLLRHAVGKLIIAIPLCFTAMYVYKYGANDFCYVKTVETYLTRPRMYPYDPDYPNFPEKSPQEYFDLGFYSSVLCQDVEKVERNISALPPPPLEETEACTYPED